MYTKKQQAHEGGLWLVLCPEEHAIAWFAQEVDADILLSHLSREYTSRPSRRWVKWESAWPEHRLCALLFCSPLELPPC